MTVEYRRELTKNTLIVEDTYTCERDSYQVRMILRAKIPMLLPCRLQILDGMQYFCYDTTEYQPLSSCFSSHFFQKEDMEHLLYAVSEAVTEVKEYLLDPSAIWLEPDFIFMSADRQKYAFCYVPGRQLPFEEAFGTLAEYFLEHLDYQEKEAVILGYGIYRKVREGHACLENLMELLSEKRQETILEEAPQYKAQELHSDLPKKQKTRQKREKEKRERKAVWKIILYGIFAAVGGVYACLKSKQIRNPFLGENAVVIEAGNAAERELPLYMILLAVIMLAVIISAVRVYFYRKKKRKKNEAEDVGWKRQEKLTVEHPTVFLDEVHRKENIHKLLNMETQEEIILSGPVFQVGKLQERGGLVLQADTVSRTHACLYQRGEEWYIEDSGSSNGTFVNDQRLELSEQLQLMPGDEVRFADKGYLFL